ncbi:MAG: murein hydrolase activator EnvC family protein [Candidatus Limnocylindria bacterium]
MSELGGRPPYPTARTASHRLTGEQALWDDASRMGGPRATRGGGTGDRRGLRALVAALVALALLFGQQAPASADDPGLEELARKKAELERAIQVSRQNAERYRQAATQFQSQVNAANARIADLARQRAAAQSEADALAIEIQIREEQLALVAFQLNETRLHIDSLNAQAAEVSRQLVRREDLYAMHLRTTYFQAQISPLEMLLSSSSLSEFASRIQTMVLVNRQDVQLAREIRSMRESVSDKQAQAAEKEQEVVGLQEQIDEQRDALTRQKAEYDALVTRMVAAIDEQAQVRAGAAQERQGAINQQAAATTQAAQLNKQLEQVEAQYAALAAELARRSGLGIYNGRLAMWPVRGPITSYFGPRWGGFHNGLDVAAPMYTPVRASASGQVVTAGRPYLAFGDTAVVVIVAHGSNFSTLYGHLDDSRALPVRVGQFVGTGGVIGNIGMTGWTTGPHVHFMTIVNGRAVDPLGYLP